MAKHFDSIDINTKSPHCDVTLLFANWEVSVASTVTISMDDIEASRHSIQLDSIYYLGQH